MNRGIKFRGYSNTSSGWVFGNLFYWMKRKKKIPIIGDGVQNGSVMGREVIRESIGQYANIGDKNGKEIYEGDIVDGGTKRGVIEFDKGLFGVNWDYGTENKTMLGAWGTQTNLRALHDGYHKSLEVVGNIYENPELLK